MFYDDASRTATDSEASFVVETTEQDKTPKVNGTPILADQSKGIKKIEVYGYAVPATVSVTGVSLNSADVPLAVGETVTLTATVSPTDADDATVTWTSDNANIATVTNGTVTAVAAGKEVKTEYDSATGIAAFASTPAAVVYFYDTGFRGVSMDVTLTGTPGPDTDTGSPASGNSGCDAGLAGDEQPPCRSPRPFHFSAFYAIVLDIARACSSVDRATAS